MAVARKATKKKAPARKTAAKKTTARKTAAKKTTRKAPAKKTAKKTTKKAAPAVITLKHIAAEMAEDHEMPKKHAEELLTDFVERVGDNLRKGKKMRISGLGILQVRARPARWGRNPATGEKIRIKASKKVAFRVAKDLKESI